MFTVFDIKTGEDQIVYAVRPVLSLAGEILETEFLLWLDSKWSWENAKWYEVAR